jgi:hypothetical protein
MASIRKVLQTRSGVTLTEITLTNGGALPVAVAYTVSSERTREVRTSHTLAAAERHFAEEVARCQAPGPKSS